MCSNSCVCSNVVVVQQSQPIYDCPPVINSFTASPGYIQCGQTALLTWSTSDATSVTISPGIGTVSSSGSYSVAPPYTTTYTLTATNADGSVSATTTVTVAPYISALGTSSGTEIASAATVSGSGQSSLLALGFGGDNTSTNSWLLYILLIALLAIAATVAVVLLTRRPSVAHAKGNAGTRAGYIPWATSTQDATETPKTSPVTAGVVAKFIAADGEQIPISGNAATLGRNDLKSLIKSDKADLISRQHIKLDYENGECYIEDNASTNGTKLNGTSIKGKGRYLLKDGDEIELADILTLTFKT